MVDNESDTELRTVAQMTMLAAQAHYRAAVCCLNDLDTKPPDMDHLYFLMVSTELILHSIEHSLKLALFIEGISFLSDHDIFILYKQVSGSDKNQPCLSGYHPHPLYVVCTHFPE